MTAHECLVDLERLRHELGRDSRVCKDSLEEKSRIVEERLEKQGPEQAGDIIGELRVAEDLLEVGGIEFLKFRESPDIEILILQKKVGVEVAHSRPRVGGARNDEATREKLLSAGQKGVFEEYGASQQIEQEFLDQVIRKKSEQCRDAKADYAWIFLYILSDSPHYVEDMEIESAWGRALREISFLTFCGCLYNCGAHRGLLTSEWKQPPDDILSSFDQHYPVQMERLNICVPIPDGSDWAHRWD